MKTKVNAFLHKVEEYLHQKVKDARMYESILKRYCRGIEESTRECNGECLRASSPYIFVIVFFAMSLPASTLSSCSIILPMQA